MGNPNKNFHVYTINLLQLWWVSLKVQWDSTRYGCGHNYQGVVKHQEYTYTSTEIIVILSVFEQPMGGKFIHCDCIIKYPMLLIDQGWSQDLPNSVPATGSPDKDDRLQKGCRKPHISVEMAPKIWGCYWRNFENFGLLLRKILEKNGFLVRKLGKFGVLVKAGVCPNLDQNPSK